MDRLVEPLLGGVYAGHARELGTRHHPAAGGHARPRLPPGGRGRRGPGEHDPGLRRAARRAGGLPGALLDSGRFTARTDATVREALHRVEGGYELVVGSGAPARAGARRRGSAGGSGHPCRAAARRPGAGGRRGAGRDRVRVHGGGDPSPSGRGIPDRGKGFRVPGPTRRGAADQGVDPVVREAGRGSAQRAGVRSTARTCCCCGPPWADTGRRRRSRPPTRGWWPPPSPTSPMPSGWPAPPSTSTCSAGAAGTPQYAVGHLDRVTRIREGVARLPGLAVCGAAYDGVGIPAVIASARRAADEVRAAE